VPNRAPDLNLAGVLRESVLHRSSTFLKCNGFPVSPADYRWPPGPEIDRPLDSRISGRSRGPKLGAGGNLEKWKPEISRVWRLPRDSQEYVDARGVLAQLTPVDLQQRLAWLQREIALSSDHSERWRTSWTAMAQFPSRSMTQPSVPCRPADQWRVRCIRSWRSWKGARANSCFSVKSQKE